MKLYRGIFGLTLISAVALTSAKAAEIYGPAQPGGYKDAPCCAFNWTGFYAGGYVGGAWSDLRVTDVDGFANPPGTKVTSDQTGFFGGGTVGYNLQYDNIVFGVGLDLGDLDVTSYKVVGVGPTRAGINGGFYADVTGRLGYSWGPSLLYAKGGFALFDTNNKFSNVVGSTASDLDLYTGWTVGGGIEYMINPAWSLKVEYLHFDFGNADFTVDPGGFRFKEELTVDTVMVGVNYRFHAYSMPLK
jgi:outer membrane immunogenic protein